MDGVETTNPTWDEVPARREYATPTRRECVKYGGAAAGGALLAGCVADSDEYGTPPGATPGGAYSVSMAPMGEVAFDAVPENVFTILGHHVDMLLALGRGDAINAMHAPKFHQSLYRKLVSHLDGVSVDWDGLYSSWPPTKEKLYALDSDVHIADPAKVATADGWDDGDLREIETSVGPWFGNTLSGTRKEPPEAFADSYRYYSLWEIFASIARVFRETERYEALASVHDAVIRTIEGNLPPQSERPSAALVLFSTSDDSMWGYKMDHPGYYAAHTRPMGVTDALGAAAGPGYGDDGRNLTLDHELLLEADPDALLVLGPMTGYHDIGEIRESLNGHEVASELSAVQNGHVYTQGARRQGPILNLFQLEMTAKQLYPDQFGEWPGYTDGDPYPEIPAGERLFNRQQVADIINGEI